MHQNPSNTEIEEDNYTQTPLQFSVHEEAVSYFNDVHSGTAQQVFEWGGLKKNA